MTGWLLDTNILSQFSAGKDGRRRASPELGDWVRRNSDLLFLSALSVVEVTAGIAKVRRSGAARRADDLEAWFGGIITTYGERVLPLDATVGKIAGVLADRARADGCHPGLADVLIAATAQAHGHGLLTNNIKHFEPLHMSVPLLNPLEQPLPGARDA